MLGMRRIWVLAPVWRQWGAVPVPTLAAAAAETELRLLLLRLRLQWRGWSQHRWWGQQLFFLRWLRSSRAGVLVTRCAVVTRSRFHFRSSTIVRSSCCRLHANTTTQDFNSCVDPPRHLLRRCLCACTTSRFGPRRTTTTTTTTIGRQKQRWLNCLVWPRLRTQTQYFATPPFSHCGRLRRRLPQHLGLTPPSAPTLFSISTCLCALSSPKSARKPWKSLSLSPPPAALFARQLAVCVAWLVSPQIAHRTPADTTPLPPPALILWRIGHSNWRCPFSPQIWQ